MGRICSNHCMAGIRRRESHLNGESLSCMRESCSGCGEKTQIVLKLSKLIARTRSDDVTTWSTAGECLKPKHGVPGHALPICCVYIIIILHILLHSTYIYMLPCLVCCLLLRVSSLDRQTSTRAPLVCLLSRVPCLLISEGVLV